MSPTLDSHLTNTWESMYSTRFSFLQDFHFNIIYDDEIKIIFLREKKIYYKNVET
jgi:hypothetical protein